MTQNQQSKNYSMHSVNYLQLLTYNYYKPTAQEGKAL